MTQEKFPQKVTGKHGHVGTLYETVRASELKPGYVIYTGHDLVRVSAAYEDVRYGYPENLEWHDVIAIEGSEVGTIEYGRDMWTPPHTEIPLYLVS